MPEALCFLCFLSIVYLQTYPSVRYRGVLPAGVASPHQQRLVRAVAFRFARRRPVLPCLCKRTYGLQKIMSFRD